MLIESPARTTSIAQEAAEAIIGPTVLLGRTRISNMVHKFYRDPATGPGETARIISTNATLASRILTVANTVQRGGGIPATTIEAATVRLGGDHARALALAYEAGSAIAATSGHTRDFASFWSQCIARGCLARAMAMNCDARIAGQAFLVGALQDTGIPLLNAAQPVDYDEILRRSGGSQGRLAMLEWQSFNLNHIYIGAELLRGWGMPGVIVDSVGKHHTSPPSAATTDAAVRLWQIAYVVGALPIGTASAHDAAYATLRRLISTAFHLAGCGAATLVGQATAEYNDIVEMFKPFAPQACPADELFAGIATALGISEQSSAALPTETPVTQLRRERAALNADAEQPAYVASIF